MTWALVALATALVVAPGPRRRSDMRRLRLAVPTRWGPIVPAAIVVAVALWVGPAVALTAVVVGFTVRMRHRRARASRSAEARMRAAGIGVDVMVAELQVGANPAAACAVAADEIVTTPGADDGPAGTARREVGEIFRRAAATARLGGSVSVAFAASGNTSLCRVARIIELTDRYGLEAAVLLESLGRDLSRRLRFDSHVRSSLAGARATATVLALLPIPGVGLGVMMGADPFAVLLDPGWGGGLLVVGVTLGCLGLIWSDAITTRAGR